MSKVMDQSPLRFSPPHIKFLSPAAVSYGGTQGSFICVCFMSVLKKQPAKYNIITLLLR